MKTVHNRMFMEGMRFLFKDIRQVFQNFVAAADVPATEPYFTMKVLDVVRHIPVEEILYFSTAGRTHRVELHTKRERLDFIGSMQELERTLGPGFCRVHRACLVNTDQITGVDLKQKELLLKNGERCVFSRTMKKKILEQVSVQAVR